MPPEIDRRFHSEKKVESGKVQFKLLTLTQYSWLYHNRLNKRDVDYAALEDEFRMGLQIEANRFREVGTSNIDPRHCYNNLSENKFN